MIFSTPGPRRLEVAARMACVGTEASEADLRLPQWLPAEKVSLIFALRISQSGRKLIPSSLVWTLPRTARCHLSRTMRLVNLKAVSF